MKRPRSILVSATWPAQENPAHSKRRPKTLSNASLRRGPRAQHGSTTARRMARPLKLKHTTKKIVPYWGFAAVLFTGREVRVVRPSTLEARALLQFRKLGLTNHCDRTRKLRMKICNWAEPWRRRRRRRRRRPRPPLQRLTFSGSTSKYPTLTRLRAARNVVGQRCAAYSERSRQRLGSAARRAHLTGPAMPC